MPIQTWSFDFLHSSVNFVARHLVVARVFGRFDRFNGTLEIDPADLSTGSVEVQIEANSVNTFNADRDNHLRNAEFLDVVRFPEITYKSSRVELRGGSAFQVRGDLTLHGMSLPLTLEAKNLGVIEKDPWGFRRILFSAHGSLSRVEHGITWCHTMQNGGWLVSERIEFELDIQATAQS